jgi:hypothetical protein
LQFEIAAGLATAVSLVGLAGSGILAWGLYRIDAGGGALFGMGQRPRSKWARKFYCGFGSLFVCGIALPAFVNFALMPLLAEILGGQRFQMQGQVKSMAPAKRTARAVKVQLTDGQWIVSRPDWWLQWIEPQLVCGADVGSNIQVIGFENSLGRTYKELRAPSCYLIGLDAQKQR